MTRLIGVVLEESVAVGGSVHVADLDSFERNGSPDNFLVKIEQGIEFVLVVETMKQQGVCRQCKI